MHLSVPIENHGDRAEDAAALRLENDRLRRRLIECTEALLKAREEVRDVERLKRDFINLVAHELRTPLTSMVGMADLLLNGYYQGEADLMAMIRTITVEGQRLSAFVSDAIEFLHWVSGSVTLNYQPCNLGEHIEDLAQNLRQGAYRDKELTVNLRVDDGTQLWADIRSLSVCLERVLDNAMKFSHTKGSIDVTGCTLTRDEERCVEVVVCDHGRGIDPTQLQRLFKAGGLCHPAENHSRGAGLSLALVREIVRCHGGDISIQSDGIDQGCKACLYFPVRQKPTPSTTKALAAILR